MREVAWGGGGGGGRGNGGGWRLEIAGDVSDDNRLERLDPKGCPPLGRKSHPSYRATSQRC